MNFTLGDTIAVICEVSPGPFSDELLISVETVNGPISGFVRSSELREEGSQSYVRGKVKQASEHVIEVWIRGEFFSTAGLASVRRDHTMAA